MGNCQNDSNEIGEYETKRSGPALKHKLRLICNVSIFTATYEHGESLKSFH